MPVVARHRAYNAHRRAFLTPRQTRTFWVSTRGCRSVSVLQVRQRSGPAWALRRSAGGWHLCHPTRSEWMHETRATDPEGRFTLVPPAGWCAAPAEEQGGLEVWREDGIGTLHLI